MKRSDLKELIKKSMLEVSPKSGAMTPEEEKMVAGYEEEEANKYALDKEEPLEEEASKAAAILNRPSNRMTFEQMGMIMMLADELGGEENAKANEFLSRVASKMEADKYIQELIAKIDGEETMLREADEIVAAWAEKKTLKEAGTSSKYWVVAKDKRGELYVFNDGYYNTKEEANNALKNISVPKIVDANTIKVQPVPTSPNYIGLFKNLSEGLNEEMHGGYLELLEMNPNFEEGVAKLLQAWNEWAEGDMTEPYMIEEAKHDILAYLSEMMK
jgi:hypothetical protein